MDDFPVVEPGADAFAGEELFSNQRDASNREVLHIVESETEKGRFYELRIGADKSFYCTCKGWISSRSEPKRCKHLTHFGQQHFEVIRGLVGEGRIKEVYLCLIPGGK